MKKSFGVSALLFSLFLPSCGGDDGSPTAPTPTPTPVATSVTLSVTSLSLASLGVTSQLSATVKDQNGATMASATVTWATSDTAVATVSSTGLVTSVADGTATITATSGSATGTATVTVAQAAATLSLSDSVLTFVSLADTTQLTATVTDANNEVIDGATVRWATSDTAVATVSDAGLVTSFGYGTATITATSGSLSATASVRSELPATQTMTVLPFDSAAVTLISPFRPSHTGIDINTTTGGHFLSPGTGIVTLVELNTGQGLPGGSNYRVRIHLTSSGLYALYHFEVNGSISDQTQRDNILVALGDQVTAGQHIGNLVSLGEHAHVHFDMLDAGGRDAVQCPLVYFSPVVAEAWESLYDEKIRERDQRRIKEGRGPVPALPDLCNEVDLPSG
jgi:hypothetical protein